MSYYIIQSLLIAAGDSKIVKDTSHLVRSFFYNQRQRITTLIFQVEIIARHRLQIRHILLFPHL
jgi:hypothetical protein